MLDTSACTILRTRRCSPYEVPNVPIVPKGPPIPHCPFVCSGVTALRRRGCVGSGACPEAHNELPAHTTTSRRLHAQGGNFSRIAPFTRAMIQFVQENNPDHEISVLLSGARNLGR